MDETPPPGYFLYQNEEFSKSSIERNVQKSFGGGISLQGLLSLCSILSKSQISTAGMTIDSFSIALKKMSELASLHDDMVEGFNRDGLSTSPKESSQYFFLPGLNKDLNREISHCIGKANRYVIFSQTAPFEEFLAALTDHCETMGDDIKIFFWIQFLSISSQNEISDSIDCDIEKTNHSLLVITSSDVCGNGPPTALTRSYSLLELALSTKCEFFDIIMPRTVRSILNQKILTDFHSTTDRFFTINIRSSSASHGSDSASDCRRRGGGLCISVLRSESQSCPGERELILKKIEDIGGKDEGAIDRIDQIISLLLMTWFISQSKVFDLSIIESTEKILKSAAQDMFELAKEDETLSRLDGRNESTTFPQSLSSVFIQHGVEKYSRAYVFARKRRLLLELQINLQSICTRIESYLGKSVKGSSQKFPNSKFNPIDIPVQQCEKFLGSTHVLTVAAHRAQASLLVNTKSVLDIYEAHMKQCTNTISNLTQVKLYKDMRQIFTIPPLQNEEMMKSTLEIASALALSDITSSEGCYIAVLEAISSIGLRQIQDEEEIAVKACIGLARLRLVLGKHVSSSYLYCRAVALLYSKNEGEIQIQQAPLTNLYILNLVLEWGCVLYDLAIKLIRQALAESATGKELSDQNIPTSSKFIEDISIDACILLSSGIEELKKRQTSSLLNKLQSDLHVERFEQKINDLKTRLESSALLKRLHETTVAAIKGHVDTSFSIGVDSIDNVPYKSLCLTTTEQEPIETIENIVTVDVTSNEVTKNNIHNTSNMVKDVTSSIPSSPKALPINREKLFEDPDVDARIRGLIVKGIISRSAVDFHKMMAKNGNTEAIKWLSEIAKQSMF